MAASVHLGADAESKSSSLEVAIHPPHIPACTLSLNVPVDEKKTFLQLQREHLRVATNN